MKLPWKRRSKTVTVIEVDTRKLFRLILVTVPAVLVLSFLIWIAFQLLPVKTCEVVGDTRYDVGELRRAAGVKREDKLYRLDTEKLEEAILSECLYIREVEVRRSFPNTLIFSVEERKPTWYLEITGDFYVLDEEMMVIEETRDEASLIRAGVTKLCLPNLTEAICGEFPVFGTVSGRSEEENRREIITTCELLVMFQRHGIKKELTALDLASRFSVSAVFAGSYEIYFGDYRQMETKILLTEEILAKNRDTYAAGELDVSVISAVGFVPRTNTGEEDESP